MVRRQKEESLNEGLIGQTHRNYHKSPSGKQCRNTPFAVLQQLEEQHPLARQVFAALTNSAEKALIEQSKKFGGDAEADKEFDEFNFNIIKGKYPETKGVDDDDVDLEYTDRPEPGKDGKRGKAYTDEVSKALQIKARERMEALIRPLVPTGCVIYALTLGGGFATGVSCDCSSGPDASGFILPIIAIVVQVYMMNHLTELMSQTEIEGRPLVRLIWSLEGLDAYRVQAFLSCIDTFCRFTRAQFVGYITNCHNGVEEAFQAVLRADGHVHTGHMDLVNQYATKIGIAGVSMFFFLLGPIIIQFGYMFYLRNKLNKEIEEMKKKKPGQPMAITDSVDDLGALMAWATMVPCSKIFDMASIPVSMFAEGVPERLWDRIKTQVMVILARNLPDGVMQANLQAWFFCLVKAQVGADIQFQLVLNVVMASIGVILDAGDLFAQNRRITVAAAVLMVAPLFYGYTRTIMAFVCVSGIGRPSWFDAYECVPEEKMAGVYGNWSSGVLPG